MVAFLRELPGDERGDAGATRLWRRRAARRAAPDLDRALAECTRCHGEDGLGRGPATPVLAGQSEAYLLESLDAYAGGPPPERRHGACR